MSKLRELLVSIEEVLGRYSGNPAAAAQILGNLYGGVLKVYGVSGLLVTDPHTVVLTVAGQHREPTRTHGAYVRALPRLIEIDAKKLSDDAYDDAAAELQAALGAYALEGDGAHVWIVPDGYMAELSANEKKWDAEGGGYFSHESMCVQNTGLGNTRCELFVYWEAEGKKVLRHTFEVPAQRSIHLRLDKIPGIGGEPFIAKSHPVGYKIVSFDAPVVVQGSRILTSGQGSEFASFGTAMAWSPA